MAGPKIWQRYFIRRFLSVALSVLFGFYTLYIIIDYASQSVALQRGYPFTWMQMILYQVCQFSYRLNILMPFSLLIATVKTLTELNMHRELIALLAGGVSLQKLLRPFVWIGLASTLLLYLNAEFVYPSAVGTITSMESKKKSVSRAKKYNIPKAQSLSLTDGSLLIYREYDPAKQLFTDAYWIQSPDNIYKIKHLYAKAPVPWGEFVDYVTRDTDGNLVSTTAARSLEFPSLKVDPHMIQESRQNAEGLALSQLWQMLPEGRCESEEGCALAAAFHYKMAMPWLCLLVILGTAPWCVIFTRTLPIFLIYASSTFTFIAFYLLMEAALVLAERQVSSPTVAIWLPFTLITALIVAKYRRPGF